MSRKLTYDTWLFAAALLLIVIGLVMIYSASAIITVQKTGFDNPYYFITKQAVFLFIGSAAMLNRSHREVQQPPARAARANVLVTAPARLAIPRKYWNSRRFSQAASSMRIMTWVRMLSKIRGGANR